MGIQNKKIWIDIEEPKNAIMFTSLIKMFQEAGANLLITARDFDSTFQILDDHAIPYIKAGRHGGEKLSDKLQAYIDRLDDLLPHVIQFKPDFFVTFGSVEGTRIAFGLQIPSIGYSDEPRSMHVSKLLFPFIDKLITPECIPRELYINLYADPEKLIRYNGIDEIAWLREYNPNPAVLDKFNLKPGKFVLMRSEPAFAGYFLDKLKPDVTLLAQFFPPLFAKFPNQSYLLLVRTPQQETWIREKLKEYVNKPNILITRYLPNVADLCFYASVVISGGGTIVRESSLLGVPSIEFFQGPSAPQEEFLAKNGFPMEHITAPQAVIDRALEILTAGSDPDRFNLSFRKRLLQFEDPNRLCFNYVQKKIEELSKGKKAR